MEISRHARKTLLALPIADARRIERAIDALAHDPRPRGAKKLVGEPRLRVGRYRLIFDVDDDVLRVLVLTIAPRKDAYRRH